MYPANSKPFFIFGKFENPSLSPLIHYFNVNFNWIKYNQSIHSRIYLKYKFKLNHTGYTADFITNTELRTPIQNCVHQYRIAYIVIQMLKSSVRKTVLLCPGQGCFDTKSLQTLSRFKNFDSVNKILRTANDALPSLELSKYIRHPELVENDNKVQQMLQRTIVQQPLLILTSVVSNEIAKLVGKVNYVQKADLMVGHSLGEISGLVLQNAIPLNEGLVLGYKRGKLMEDIARGSNCKNGLQGYGMYALVFQPKQYGEVVNCLKSNSANIANYNTYSQVVISGKKVDLKEQIKQVKVEVGRIRAIDLNVSIPFHHPMLGQIEKALRNAFGKAKVRPGELEIPMISDLDAKLATTSEEQVDKVIKVTSRPVKFSKCLETFCHKSDKEKPDVSYDFVSYGTPTHGLVKRFFKDLEKRGRKSEIPEYTNIMISDSFGK